MRHTIFTLLICTVAVASGAQTTQEKAPVFTDSIDVRVVELNVAVVNSEDQPMTGLEMTDFSVSVDGQAVDVVGLTPMAAAAQVEGLADRLVILFDLPSLERRPRTKLIAEVAPFVQSCAERGGRILIATTSPGFEIVEGFSSDPAALAAAFDEVSRSEIDGEQLMAKKRTVNRAIRTADTYQLGFSKPSEGSDALNQLGVNMDFGAMQGTQYLANVNALRDYETVRILRGLGGLEAAVRCTAGPGRRKDVLWLGQNLLTRPALDLYQAMYKKFEPWADTLDMDRPEIWAEEKNLTANFEHLNRIAQLMGATIHVIDVAESERTGGLTDISDTSPMSTDSGSQVSSKTMGPIGVERASDWVDGGAYLAINTGGVFSMGIRSAGDFIDRLGVFLRSSYVVAYTPIAALDGGLESVEVRVDRPGAEVRAMQRVARMSPDHMLVDRAVSELLLGLDEDPLNFTVALAQRQDVEDGRFIQSFRLEIPTALMQPEQDGALMGCTLRVAVVISDSGGNVGTPRLFPLELHLPAARVAQAKRAAMAFRLMMDAEPMMIGIALRDEATGMVGGHSVSP